MKQKNDQNANIGLQQKNSILQAWANLKDSIFNVLFVLLDKNDDDTQQSVWGLAFESGLDYLQMLAFPFDAAIIAVWNGGNTLQNITVLFSKLNISSYLPGVSFGAFLVLLYSLIFLIIFVIVDIIYVSYSFSKKKFKFTWPLVLLAQIVPLFVTVFFLPMTETLLSVVRCKSTTEGHQVMISFPDVVCWEGWHLFHAAVTLLFVSIFVFISSVVALALFQPRMTTNKLTARQNSTAEVVFIINKIVCQFVFSFTPFDATWVYCAMLFVFAFWQFWCYTVNEPYYSKKATKFFKIVSAYYFWTTFMLMVSQILSIYEFNGGLVIWLGGLPFLFIIILFERKSSIGKLFAGNLKFRNGQELESHITYVLQLIENQKKDKNSYMLLIGYIEKHKEICTQEDCPFNKNLKKKNKLGGNEMEDNCIQLLKQLQRMYRVGIKKYPESTKLRLSFAFFHLERTKNKNKAYEQFSNAQETDPSFEQQFIIYRFKKIIRENLEDDDKGGSSDLIEMIRFDNHISLCEQAMLMSARLHKEFWAELKQEIPDLKKLNSIGSKITQTGNAVKENYVEICKINSSVPQILHNYAIYLLLIIEDYVEGRDLLANSKKIFQDKLGGSEKMNEQNDIFYTEKGGGDRMLSPILVVSRNEDKLGKIINSNLMLTEISGYYKEELVDRDFHKLLPETYATAHQFTLSDWSRREDSNSEYFSRLNQGFIKQKSGRIVPVIYNVKYNIVEEEFLILFWLDTARATKCYILVDSMGLVKQFSTMVKNMIKFQGNQIDSCPVYLQQLGINNYDNEQYKDGIKKLLNLSEGEKVCNIKITPIQMKSDYGTEVDGNENCQNDQEDNEQFLVSSKQTVGYVVEITPVVQYANEKSSTDIGSIRQQGRRNEQQKKQSGSQQQSEGEQSDNEEESMNSMLNKEIIDLYKAPDMAEVFLSKFAESKKGEVVLRQFQLKEKIKTMRLLDNEIKMVYNQSSENDCNSGREGMDLDDIRQAFKFDDQAYQGKLRKAINTNINHSEISRLKWISLVFMIALFGFQALQLVFSVENLTKIEQFGTKIRQKSEQMQYLCQFMNGALDPLFSNEVYHERIQNYNIEYSSEIKVPFKIYNQEKLEEKELKDVLVMLHSKLMEYFASGETYTLDKVYFNFVNYVYNAFEDNEITVNLSKLIPYLFFGLILVITSAMIAYWIYISLQLDKKKYDIMIWFLDIPIPYVSHLSSHCDKYLKDFIGIKELMQKGINVDDIDETQYKEFAQSNEENKEEEIQEQIKARKSLISKHRKETLCSKLNFSYVQMFWLLFYACFVSVIIILSSETLISDFEFLYPHWILTAHQVNWGSSLPVANILSQQTNNEMIGEVNIVDMMNSLQINHLNYISEYDMASFNKQILDYSQDLDSTYNTVYFQSLCAIGFTADEVVLCDRLLSGKLSVGYSIYSKYLASAPDDDYEQIRKANEFFMVPSLINVLKSWEDTMKSSISSKIGLVSITLYIYIIFTALGFLVFWLMYLKGMNTQLNQTIQMLNMIPFKLLPKSRKETKQFITWIIKEANKKKHESD